MTVARSPITSDAMKLAYSGLYSQPMLRANARLEAIHEERERARERERERGESEEFSGRKSKNTQATLCPIGIHSHHCPKET